MAQSPQAGLPASDEELVHEFANGRIAAFDELYIRYWPSVHRFHTSLCGDEAEDLTQECFKRVLRVLHQFDPERGSFKTWLFAIANNRKMSYLKRVKSKLVQLSQSFDGLSSQSPMVSEMTVTATRCLSQLDERSRLVIALNVIAGFTIDETAVTLGLTTSAVASIKRRALLKLRECCRGIEDEK